VFFSDIGDRADEAGRAYFADHVAYRVQRQPLFGVELEKHAIKNIFLPYAGKSLASG
jgi:hypothetical protein